MRALAVALALASFASLTAQAAPSQSEDPLLAQRHLASAMRRAVQLYDGGEYQASADFLAGLSGPEAGDTALLNLRGAILSKLGKLDEAEKIFSGILATDPSYFPAGFNFGEAKFLGGDYRGALDIFEELHRREHSNELVRFNMLLCFLQLGKNQDADKLVASLYPVGSTPAWYFAQAVMLRRQNDERGAQKHLRAAHSIFGDKECRVFDEALAAHHP
jgi:tetratricopeptide (TPR) repeat protein